MAVGGKPFFETKSQNKNLWNRSRDFGRSLARQKWKLLSLIFLFVGMAECKADRPFAPIVVFNDQMQTGPTLWRSLKPIQYLKAFLKANQQMSPPFTMSLVIRRGWWLCLGHPEHTLSINITSWQHVRHKNLSSSHFSSCPKNNYNKATFFIKRFRNDY